MTTTEELDLDHARRVLEALIGVPGTDGNEVRILRNGDEIFPAMLDAIRSAERSVDFSTFVWWRGEIAREFAEAFAERARAGVRVRVVLDDFGSSKMDHSLRGLMRDAGVKVIVFRPLWSWKVWKVNMRTHRRVLLVDEAVAFTGGVGIAHEWTGDGMDPDSWRDTSVRLRGPAVAGIRGAFVSEVLEEGYSGVAEGDRFPPLHPAGDSWAQVVRTSSQLGWNDMGTVFEALLTLARRCIRISTPYLRPPHHYLKRLCEAAKAGVQVQLLVPGPHNDRPVVQLSSESNFATLLEAGAEVWQYQPSMLHAKVVTVDGALATVGTTNFDSRSLALNEQLNVVVADPRVTAVLDRQFDEDLSHSRRVEPEEWRDRTLAHKLAEKSVNLAAYGFRGAGAANDGRFLPQAVRRGNWLPDGLREAVRNRR